MASIREMAEAHLLNVEREINTLRERKVAIDVEISKLAAYLEEGRNTLLEASSTQAVIPGEPQNVSGPTVFSPQPL